MSKRNQRIAASVICVVTSIAMLSGCNTEADQIVGEASTKARAIDESVANQSAKEPGDTASSDSPEPDDLGAGEPIEGSSAGVQQVAYSGAGGALYSSIDGIVDPGEYVNELKLGGMVVYWANDAELLWMALSAPATGYVTVGFDPVNRKVGANYIIGFVKNGETTIRDHVGTRGNLHEADVYVGGEDNLLATAGSEIDGVTILEFVIPLDSGDSKDRPLIPGGTYEIQVAYQQDRDDFISWHSRHGIGEFTIDVIP